VPHQIDHVHLNGLAGLRLEAASGFLMRQRWRETPMHRTERPLHRHSPAIEAETLGRLESGTELVGVCLTGRFLLAEAQAGLSVGLYHHTSAHQVAGFLTATGVLESKLVPRGHCCHGRCRGAMRLIGSDDGTAPSHFQA
jgi:hypothetical protein